MKFDVTSVAALSRSNGIQAFADTIKEIKEATLPALRNYQSLLEKDKGAMRAASESNRALAGASNKPWPTAVIAALELHLKKENEIEELIEEIVPAKVEVEQIDSRSVQIAQYIDSLNYVSTYSRSLVLMEVDNAAKALKLTVSPVLSMGENKDIVKDFPAFRLAFGQVAAWGKQDITKLVRAVPDYVVSAADMETMQATYGGKVSPLAQNFISASWNPIFKIRSVFNARQIERYQVAKEQRQNLEYRIQVMTNTIENGEGNPGLERELEYHTGRLKRLVQEMETIEERTR